MRARSWFAAATALYAAVWVWAWTRLPARVPVHFGPGGEPDTWAGRPAALVGAAVLGLAMAAVFAGCARFVRRCRPELVNVPNPGYWKRAENLDRLRGMITTDLWLIGAWTFLLLTGVQWLVVRAATADDPGLGPWPLVLVGGYLVGLAAHLGWMFTRRYAVPPEP
ncbi:DUF1648 domain-containing protein [Blastococcus sp. SYSU DS0552]